MHAYQPFSHTQGGVSCSQSGRLGFEVGDF